MPVRLPTLVHSNFSHLRVHRSSQLDVAKREAILAVQRAKELAASLAAVSGQAKAWASLSYELICTDPQISKHVHTLTGFHSVKALQLFMGLLNADGLFAGINPCTVPQESDVHHVEYVQNDRTPFQSGAWLRVHTAVTGRCVDGSSFPIPVDTLVYVTNPRRTMPDAPIVPPGFVFVTVPTGDKKSGQIPVACVELSQSPEDDAYDPRSNAGRPRAMSWESAVCFVLSILCAGADITDAHMYWGVTYATACRYVPLTSYYTND